MKSSESTTRPIVKLREILADNGVVNEPLAERLEAWVVARDVVASDQLDEIKARLIQLRDSVKKKEESKMVAIESLMGTTESSTIDNARNALAEMFDAGFCILTAMKDGETVDSFFSFGNQHTICHLAENTSDILFPEEDDEEPSEDDDTATL